jgi:3-deoxy-D-manno-octulosonic-acid transferase
MLKKLIGERPVLICASTRDGEEALILEALDGLTPENTLVIMVPRHPQRFDEVEKMIKSRNWEMLRRSELGEGFTRPIPPGTQILLGDSMGEMFSYYTACDVAFIGGGLKPLGGQNLIEACALGKPVIVGPHTFNFESITQDAVAVQAAIRIHSAQEMVKKAGKLLQDAQLRADMGSAAYQFALQQQGATQKTLDLLNPLLQEKALSYQPN